MMTPTPQQMKSMTRFHERAAAAYERCGQKEKAEAARRQAEIARAKAEGK
jgi:hypothetical protein